jgi:ubiquinone/menaquinone biosynthesis C-methylase UbiE
MLPRILELELMDTAEDAHQYDTMDHSIVNAQFVTDLLAAFGDWPSFRQNALTGCENAQAKTGPVSLLHILDLGAGTAQIPIELARRATNVHITAIDAAQSMLALADKNVAAANLSHRIDLFLADAKNLQASDHKAATGGRGSAESRFENEKYAIVISNSILHHVADPRTVLAEAVRVTARGGLLFHRDLARPNDEAQLQHLVNTYAGDATPYQRKLFADSLRAALTLDEIRELVAALGFARNTVQFTSDRHWTWSAINTPSPSGRGPGVRVP